MLKIVEVPSCVFQFSLLLVFSLALQHCRSLGWTRGIQVLAPTLLLALLHCPSFSWHVLVCSWPRLLAGHIASSERNSCNSLCSPGGAPDRSHPREVSVQLLLFPLLLHFLLLYLCAGAGECTAVMFMPVTTHIQHTWHTKDTSSGRPHATHGHAAFIFLLFHPSACSQALR